MEEKVVLEVPVEKKISAKLPVFYNPAMKPNRDLTILLLEAVDDLNMQMCDLLAGSGVRSIRFLKELSKSKIKRLVINDFNPNSKELITRNLTLNEIQLVEPVDSKDAFVKTENADANLLLLSSSGFDYIDIDPFGTPNPFLDASVVRLSRNGILAVTATDTSSLAGTFPKTCIRKYWARPDNGPLKHELGLRILIRKVQLMGAQHDKALIPIFSYSKDHYMRIFFRCKKGKQACDFMLKNHGIIGNTGPLWLGLLWDEEIVENMLRIESDRQYGVGKFLQIISAESKIGVVGFYDIHNICKKNKLDVPKFGDIFNLLKQGKYNFSRTHFSDFGIRSDISEEKFITLIQRLSLISRKAVNGI